MGQRVASRTLLWAGHVARMSKNRLSKRLLLSWVHHPRLSGGQEVPYDKSLNRHLNHFNLPLPFTEWAALAQDRQAWYTLVTKAPFVIGKPFLRRPRGDTRVSAEDRRQLAARDKAEIKERRELFADNAKKDILHEKKPHSNPEALCMHHWQHPTALEGDSVTSYTPQAPCIPRTCPIPPNHT